MKNKQTSPYDPQPRGKLLVVEDDIDQWFLIRYAVKHHWPGIEVIWSPDADQALAYLTASGAAQLELPELILLDLYLPRREDGWQFLQSLKQSSRYSQVPVVVLSYSSLKEDIAQSYFYGSSDYIIKPIALSQWTACLKSLRFFAKRYSSQF